MKRIAFPLVFVIVLLLGGCQGNEIVDIAFEDDVIEYRIGTNQLDDYNIVLYYEDGDTETIPVSGQMLLDGEADKLATVGDVTLRFSHEGISFEQEFRVFQHDLDLVLLSIYYQSVSEVDLDMSYDEWLESIAGEDGREVTFRVEQGYIQWQYVGDDGWTDLLDLGSIAGTDGRSVRLDVVDGHVAWQYEGDDTWTNLFEIQTSGDAVFVTDIQFDETGSLVIVFSDDSTATLTPNKAMHIVNFFDLNGSIIDSQLVLDGDDATAPLYDPVGHTFIEWDHDLTTITSNLNVYPVVEALRYDVVFDVQGGDPVDPVLDVAYGATVALPIPEREGHRFLGWHLGTTSTATEFTDHSIVTGDTTLYAHWQTELHSIVFDTGDGSGVATITQYYGTDVAQPADPVHDTKIFQGWFVDPDCTIPYEFSTMSAQDTTVYAKWLDMLVVPNDDTDPSYMIIQDYYSDFAEVEIPSHYHGLPIQQIGNGAFEDATFETITLPETINYIGDSAFRSADNLTSIVLPETVNYLGTNIFNGAASLTSVTLPTGISYIPAAMFRDTTSLTSITLHEGITSINASAFNGSGLTSVVLPTTLQHIQSSAFRGSKITSLTIPEGTRTMDSSAFEDCLSLETVLISSTVQQISHSVFNNTPALESITVSDENAYYSSLNGVLYDKDQEYLIQYPAGSASSSFTVPSSVLYMDERAFWYAQHLTTLSIPDNLEYLSHSFFFYMETLQAIDVYDNGGDYWSSLDGVLYNGNQTTLVKYPIGKTDATFSLPATVTRIATNAFRSNQHLTAIIFNAVLDHIDGGAFYDVDGITTFDLPASVTRIEGYAFSEMDLLSALTIPDQVTEISHGLFLNATALTSVSLPDGLLTIRSTAFSNATALTSITIPASVTMIESNAFQDCFALSAINVDASNASYQSIDGVLFSSDQTDLVQYPAGKTDVEYVVPDGTMDILETAFYNNDHLQRVTLPSSVRSIALNSFSDMDALTEVHILRDFPLGVITGYHSMFANHNDSLIIYVSVNVYALYLTDTFWDDYADILQPVD